MAYQLVSRLWLLQSAANCSLLHEFCLCYLECKLSFSALDSYHFGKHEKNCSFTLN
uniref:C2H2-type domain-containing protein n=1 Tax=Octopus bimaculoides TaxID=37653 RepID=A0A0L8HC39_OCTBM